MQGFFTAAERVLRALELVGIAVAVVAFALMLGVTVVDVVRRYLFNSPLTWAFELMTSYLMVAGFFMAISAAQADRQHISIDILSRHFPPRLRAGLLALALVLGVILMGAITWAGWHGLERAWLRGLVTDGIIPWPRWPTYALLTFGSALLTLRLTVEAAANALAALGVETGWSMDAAPAGEGGH